MSCQHRHVLHLHFERVGLKINDDVVALPQKPENVILLGLIIENKFRQPINQNKKKTKRIK